MLIAVLLLFAALPISATRKIPAPTRAQMIGAWFGFNNHDDFLRLNLKADGSGTLVWLQLGGESRSVYEIPKWEWNEAKWKLDFMVKGRTGQEEEMWVRVKSAGHREIELSCGGKILNWKREATLRKESEVLTKLKAATVD